MAIKHITVEQAGKLLAAIDKQNKDFGVTTKLAEATGRDACIMAEVIFEAVDAHRAANRKPRTKAGK